MNLYGDQNMVEWKIALKDAKTNQDIDTSTSIESKNSKGHMDVDKDTQKHHFLQNLVINSRNFQLRPNRIEIYQCLVPRWRLEEIVSKLPS